MFVESHPVNCIVPPHIFRRLLESQVPGIRDSALQTMSASVQLRTKRTLAGSLLAAAPAGAKRRTIYDAKQQWTDSGELARGEGDADHADPAVNEAHACLGLVYDFFLEQFQRNSIDDRGQRLDAVVHYGKQYSNAFWNGQQMIFGDGDGTQFGNFTNCLDVIAHELTHGVTEQNAGLVYHGQSGALNESFSDVFASLIKQWHLQQKAQDADWLIGSEVFTPQIAGDALRSLKTPGAAYLDPTIGRDPQPAHMEDYVQLADTPADDWGGVHINSGIPNHAFYLAAIALRGEAWREAGHIWYETLRKRLWPTANFQDCANATVSVAAELYGTASIQADVVANAWAQVGIDVPRSAAQPQRTFSTAGGDTQADLKQQLEAMSRQLQTVLAKLG